MKTPLRLISLSDIHLGHHKTSTDFIIRNLKRYWPSKSDMQEIDLVILAGDIFDRLLDFNSPAAFDIKRWMHWTLEQCKANNTIIRVLEGTPSHDHKQNKWWQEANEIHTADFDYIDRLCIEHIDSLDIDILWIPDEWKPSTDTVWLDAKTALSQSLLDSVDFTVIHGTMDHQVPHGLKLPHHITQRYLDITKHYVLTGHIHQSCVKDRCLTNGSFDRLCHGDEGKKGYWDITIKETGNEIVFVENANAKVYKTIDLSEIEDNLSTVIKDVVKDIPEDSFIRLLANPGSTVISNFESIRADYPNYYWTIKPHRDKVDGIQTNLLQDRRDTFEQRLISKDNIEEILLKRLQHLDPNTLNGCLDLLRRHL